MAPNTRLIEWLGAVLAQRGWDQAELARRSGISRAQISRIMSGDQNPGLDSLRGFARALDLSMVETLRRAEIIEEETELPYGARDWGARLMALSPEHREAVVSAMDNVLRLGERTPVRRAPVRRSPDRPE